MTKCLYCRYQKMPNDMFCGIQCWVCYCANISLKLSQPQKNGIMHRWIKGLTHQRSRFVHVQVKKRVCAECGEPLFVSCDHFKHGVRLLQLNCRGLHQHSWYAHLSTDAKIIAIYNTGDWARAAGQFDDGLSEIPF